MNEIRASNKSIGNRLASIIEDADFVTEVSKVYELPLIANKRCGVWYVPTHLKSEESYFKSTDGHFGHWQFSAKRLNLHLIELIENNGGIIVVDSTRSGKRMPDALAKTVPIWCAVLNQVALGVDLVAFPQQCVSRSEQNQITQLIPEMVQKFKNMVPPALWPQLSKPLRPLFITPDAVLPPAVASPIFENEHAVICVTASTQAQDGEFANRGFVYVQGAADDHELWSPVQHFSAEMFWHPLNDNLRERGIADEEIERRIHNAVVPNSEALRLIAATSSIYIVEELPPESLEQRDIIIDLKSGEWALETGKKGIKMMMQHLLSICDYYESLLTIVRRCVIIGELEFCHCIALMLSCRYFNEHGKLRDRPSLFVSKEDVVRRNAHIIAQTRVIPSRAAQNAIGSFLRNKNRK